MTLGQLIARLEKADPNRTVPLGFGRPHSYRGYYDELAFDPVMNTTVGAMLKAAKSALGTIYPGWKGGEYKMESFTEVWLAKIGECGESIGPVLLDYMLGEVQP